MNSSAMQLGAVGGGGLIASSIIYHYHELRNQADASTIIIIIITVTIMIMRMVIIRIIISTGNGGLNLSRNVKSLICKFRARPKPLVLKP